MHITLEFLGYLTDEEVLQISKIVREVAARHQPFLVKLTKISYGPPKKMPPKLIWVEGERIKELVNLKADLEKALIDSGIRFESEDREFRPHITLGRIRRWEWRQIEPEERPEVEEAIELSFDVKSIEVMESQLKRDGAEYTILESHLLSE